MRAQSIDCGTVGATAGAAVPRYCCTAAAPRAAGGRPGHDAVRGPQDRGIAYTCDVETCRPLYAGWIQPRRI